MLWQFFVGYLSASPIGKVGIKDNIVRRPKPLFSVFTFTFSEGEPKPPGPSETHIVQNLGDLIKQPIVTGDKENRFLNGSGFLRPKTGFLKIILEVWDFRRLPLGTGDSTKTNEFSENFLSIEKFILHILDLYTGLSRVLFKKKVQYYFPKMRGGGQRPFGIFPKFHPFWYRHPSLI